MFVDVGENDTENYGKRQLFLYSIQMKKSNMKEKYTAPLNRWCTDISKHNSTKSSVVLTHAPTAKIK
jgi:hypothetical protein